MTSTPGPRDEELALVEHAAEEACQRQQYEAAATIVLERYGGEIYGFLLAQFRGDQAAVDEVFSDFTEDFWRGLPSFRWGCSIRAWCYKLARSAAARHRRMPHNRRDRRVPVSELSFFEQLSYRARTSTRPHLRTEVKDEFQKLRERLTQDDQDLLILRVDRQLSFREVAFAMLPNEEPADEQQLKKLEVALRQRFGDVKRRLRKLAEEAGLL